MSSRDEGIKKSDILESLSLEVIVAPAISGGPAAPNAAFHSDENSLLDGAAGVFKISFSSVMSSLSTSKSADSKSTAPGIHTVKQYVSTSTSNKLPSGYISVCLHICLVAGSYAALVIHRLKR